jgi:hypothetical protein
VSCCRGSSIEFGGCGATRSPARRCAPTTQRATSSAAPWRQLPEATDRWFLADRPKSLAGTSASAPQPPTLETGSFDLRRRLSDSTRLALLAVAALIAIVVLMFALTPGSTHATTAPAAPIVTAPSTVPAAVTPPAVGSPTVKPADAFVAGKRHFAHRRRR